MEYKKFEYQLIDIPTHFEKVHEYNKWLNLFGQEGWEAVYQDFRKVGTRTAPFICFKRQILSKPQP